MAPEIKNSNLKRGIMPTLEDNGEWDIEDLTEQIWNELDGEFARSTIHEIVENVIPEYENARIQTFVPIFIRRDTLLRLRASLFAHATSRPADSIRDGSAARISISEETVQLTSIDPTPKDAQSMKTGENK